MKYGSSVTSPIRFSILVIFVLAFLSLLNGAAHAEKFMQGHAQRLDQSNSADAPRTAIDSAGNVIAVWTQFDALPSRAGVWVNHYSVGRGWGTPQLINNNSGQAADPQIAMNAQGNAVVVWMQYSASVAFKTNIWANRYSKETGWGQAQQIQDDSVNGYFAKVGMDRAGNAMVVWSQNDLAQDKTHIYANRYSVGQGWSTGVLIQSDSVTLANEPQIAMDTAGNASVVWAQYDATFGGIWTNRYTVGNGWATAQNIGNDTGSSPKIAVDDRGGAMAAWTQLDMTTWQNNVYARHFVAGQWEALQLIQANTQSDARALQIVMNARGNSIALWEEREFDQNSYTTTSAVYAADYSRGQGWMSAARLGDSKWAYPSLAMDDRGNAVAVWEREDTTQTQQDLYVYRHNPRQGWDNGALVERQSGNAGNAHASMNDRIGVIAWRLQDTAGSTSLWARISKTGETGMH